MKNKKFKKEEKGEMKLTMPMTEAMKKVVKGKKKTKGY